MTDWYYAEDGQPQGPVPQAKLAAMLREGSLPASTQVWTEAFGEDWRQASDTDLVPPRRGPPPLRPASPLSGPLDASSVRRPMMPPNSQNDAVGSAGGYALALAFTPLAVLVIDATITLAAGYPDKRTDNFVNLWGAIAVIACAVLDSRNLAQAGLNPKGRYLAPFILLTPLGYLWRRAAVIGSTYRLVLIWLACAIGLVVGEFLLLSVGARP